MNVPNSITKNPKSEKEILEDLKFYKEVEKINIEIKGKDEKDTTIFTSNNNNTKVSTHPTLDSDLISSEIPGIATNSEDLIPSKKNIDDSQSEKVQEHLKFQEPIPNKNIELEETEIIEVSDNVSNL